MARAFTKDEDHLLVTLHEQTHAGWGTIGVRLGRKASVCAARYQRLSGQEPRAKKLATQHVSTIKVSEKALAARDDRETARETRDEAHLARGDLTPSFFGDPPPGYSALDRKRQAEART